MEVTRYYFSLARVHFVVVRPGKQSCWRERLVVLVHHLVCESDECCSRVSVAWCEFVVSLIVIRKMTTNMQQGTLLDVLKKKMRQTREEMEKFKEECDDYHKRLQVEIMRREEVSPSARFLQSVFQ